jgi:protein O-mannosyl-transferase
VQNSRPKVTANKESCLKIVASLALLCILAFAAYWPSLHAPFVFDDQFAIAENHSIEHLSDVKSVLSPPPDAAGAAGRPLVNLTLAINYAFGRYNVFGYHLLNVTLHVLTSVVLFLVLLRSLTLDSRYAMSLSLVGLWTLHPLLTESVSCIIQRDEVLGALFILLTLYAFIRSVDTSIESHSRLWKSVSLLACSLGIGAKETIVCAPLIVLIYDSFYVSGSYFKSLRQRTGYYVLLFATWIPLLFLILSTNKRGGTVGFGLGVTIWQYLITQINAIYIYLKLIFWPNPLVIDYGTQLVRGLSEIFFQAVVISSLVVLSLYGFIKKQTYGFLGVIFFILLAPSSSIVPLVTQPIAEHRMYLPSFLVCLSFGFGFIRFIHLKLIPLFSFGLTLLLAIITYFRNEDYQSELNLINQAIRYNPQNDRAYLNRGTLLSRDGKIDLAIKDYENALSLEPKSADTYFNLALLIEEKGDWLRAINYLKEAVNIKPNYPIAYFEIGFIYFKMHDYRSAILYLEQALKLQPTRQKTRKLLSQSYALLGDDQAKHQQFVAALDWYESALNLDIGNSRLHCNLGNVFSALGKKSEAINEYKEAIRYDSRNIDAHYNLAQELLDQGKYDEAQRELALVSKLNLIR